MNNPESMFVSSQNTPTFCVYCMVGAENPGGVPNPYFHYGTNPLIHHAERPLAVKLAEWLQRLLATAGFPETTTKYRAEPLPIIGNDPKMRMLEVHDHLNRRFTVVVIENERPTTAWTKE